MFIFISRFKDYFKVIAEDIRREVMDLTIKIFYIIYYDHFFLH